MMATRGDATAEGLVGIPKITRTLKTWGRHIWKGALSVGRLTNGEIWIVVTHDRRSGDLSQ